VRNLDHPDRAMVDRRIERWLPAVNAVTPEVSNTIDTRRAGTVSLRGDVS
jgi:hypothetical protein